MLLNLICILIITISDNFCTNIFNTISKLLKSKIFKQYKYEIVKENDKNFN